MIEGIPYFGENNNDIWEKIISTKIDIKKYYNSIYHFITEHIDKKAVVIINDKYLTWLNDIVFNYRDKEVYIPYYSYKEHEMRNRCYRTDNKGHLKMSECMDTIQVRYEYKYEKLYIGVDNFSITIFDLDADEKYVAELYNSRWYNSTKFDIEELYNKYLDSCYKDDDFILNKHMGGYHYINKSIKNFENREKKLRELEGLYDYDIDNRFDTEYRDVRNYKYEEVIHKVGFRDTSELYKIRRLRFESLLYCILRDNCNPKGEQFKKSWHRLGLNKEYIKYGDSIKLIFKSYWLDNYKAIKQKSWSRVEQNNTK